MQALSQSEAKITEVPDGSIISPAGFKTGGVHAGLRYSKKDLGVIYCEIPASAAAVYTTSKVQAAPLHVTQESIAEAGMIQAVVVNSACANACTGEKGYQDALMMREYTAEQFNLASHYVAVASTGVIGEFLQMDKIETGIKQLTAEATKLNAEDFQTAILTTDTVPKASCYSAVIDGKLVTMGGAAKGSGMIHPNMATMLAFVTTDATVNHGTLQEALKSVTNNSFNQITVDGDTSTNDMVLVMANGKAGNNSLTPQHPEWDTFVELLSATCENLAKQIARDGEGATKLIEVEVTGAINEDDARKAAKQIVGSNLVKTAMYGADANWGRIIGALGQSGVSIDSNNVDITIGHVNMLKNSEPQSFSEEEATAYLQNKEVKILVELHQGTGKGKAWGCDLSYDYVKINASYRT